MYVVHHYLKWASNTRNGRRARQNVSEIFDTIEKASNWINECERRGYYQDHEFHIMELKEVDLNHLERS